MKHLKDETFITAIKRPFKIRWGEDDPEHDATVAEVLRHVLSQYQPTQGKQLDMGGLRTLNKCIDILESDPENGYHAFEDADWKMLNQVFEWMGPLVQPRNAPLLEDHLNAAKENISPPKPSKNGPSDEPVTHLEEVKA